MQRKNVPRSYHWSIFLDMPYNLLNYYHPMECAIITSEYADDIGKYYVIFVQEKYRTKWTVFPNKIQFREKNKQTYLDSLDMFSKKEVSDDLSLKFIMCNDFSLCTVDTDLI